MMTGITYNELVAIANAAAYVLMAADEDDKKTDAFRYLKSAFDKLSKILSDCDAEDNTEKEKKEKKYVN